MTYDPMKTVDAQWMEEQLVVLSKVKDRDQSGRYAYESGWYMQWGRQLLLELETMHKKLLASNEKIRRLEVQLGIIEPDLDAEYEADQKRITS